MSVARKLSTRAVHRSAYMVVVAAALAIVAGWWWGPALSHDPEVAEVAVLVEPADVTASDRDDIERRVRQSGRSVVVIGAVNGCAETALAGDAQRVVFASQTAVALCDSVGGVRRAVELVLLGQPASRVASCEWWDTPGSGEARPGLGQCRPDGSVVIRTADGSLTPAGSERLARAVVALLE